MQSNDRLTKVSWDDIRKSVAKVNPTFAKLVDELSPGKDLPMYLAKYAYGEIVADTEQFFFPNPTGSGIISVNDERLPAEVKRDLKRGVQSMPFGMVLNKRLETYSDLPLKRLRYPGNIWKPGDLFPLVRILSQNCKRKFYVNTVVSGVAGSACAFTLPSIGRVDLHTNLQNTYRIKSAAAKSMYDHWQIFKEIANSDFANSAWRMHLLLFADKWEDMLHRDPAWTKLKLHLHEQAWEFTEYRRNQIFYDIAFSSIQEKRNLKPNPYLTDTAAHLLSIAIGAVIGYRPAVDETSLPLKLLQTAFVEAYSLPHYTPIIMEPDYFYFESSKPNYYSLQNPSTHRFSPKSRRIVNTLFETRELAHIMDIFIDEASKKGSMCAETRLGMLKEKVSFSFYHNQEDRHGIIKPSNSPEIIELDSRLQKNQQAFPDRTFCADAKFMRGCIAIRRK